MQSINKLVCFKVVFKKSLLEKKKTAHVQKKHLQNILKKKKKKSFQKVQYEIFNSPTEILHGRKIIYVWIEYKAVI